MEEQNTKHTPGPWKSRYDFASSRTSPSIDVRDAGGDLIASVPRKGRKYETAKAQSEQEANARLLENAPALLAFAQMIANGGINAAGEAQIEAEARELIRAATGQD